MNLKHLFLAIAALAVSYTAGAQNNKSFADEHISLSGYLQGGYSWDSGSNPETTFYLKRARISLTGNAPKEKFDYRLQVDMAGSPKICDLYFRYKPSSAFGVQVGQFKLPFAIENDIYGPTTVELIDYSFITTYLVRNDKKYDGIASTGRDIGVQIFGGFGDNEDYQVLSYNVGIFNGAGINAEDNNDAKDIVARVILKPSKEISLSGSVMKTETVYDLSTINSNRWALGVIYDTNGYILRGEYAGAKFNNKNVHMFYALGGLKIQKDWMLIARYETINPSNINNYINRVTVGAVYKPYKFLRCQFNYAVQYGPRVHSSGLNLMLTAIF
ncbi:MAG: hypothetical protein IKK05_04770 [Alistipes sp.]|nr:hypothetical protein [Alistipes sp.]